MRWAEGAMLILLRRWKWVALNEGWLIRETYIRTVFALASKLVLHYTADLTSNNPVNMKLSLITLLSASALVSAAPVAEAEPFLDERQAAQSIDALTPAG